MCPVFIRCEDTALWNWRVQIRFLSMGLDEKRNLQIKNKHKRRICRSHCSAALIKQDRQDDLRRATRTFAKRVEKCIEVDGGIFEHLLWTVAIYWDHLHEQ
jgi:hypothetical protein